MCWCGRFSGINGDYRRAVRAATSFYKTWTPELQSTAPTANTTVRHRPPRRSRSATQKPETVFDVTPGLRRAGAGRSSWNGGWRGRCRSCVRRWIAGNVGRRRRTVGRWTVQLGRRTAWHGRRQETEDRQTSDHAAGTSAGDGGPSDVERCSSDVGPRGTDVGRRPRTVGRRTGRRGSTCRSSSTVSCWWSSPSAPSPSRLASSYTRRCLATSSSEIQTYLTDNQRRWVRGGVVVRMIGTTLWGEGSCKHGLRATPVHNAHLHFAGLEPAAGLRPALCTVDHTSSTTCRYLISFYTGRPTKLYCLVENAHFTCLSLGRLICTLFSVWTIVRPCNTPLISACVLWNRVYPHKNGTVAENWAKNLKGNRLHSLQSTHFWKWPVVKYKHIKIKPRICVLFVLCSTWTVNANSLKQNIKND